MQGLLNSAPSSEAERGVDHLHHQQQPPVARRWGFMRNSKAAASDTSSTNGIMNDTRPSQPSSTSTTTIMQGNANQPQQQQPPSKKSRYPTQACALAHACVKKGDLEELDKLITSDPSVLTLEDRGGQTLLHAAVDGENLAIVTALMEKWRLDVNRRDKNGWTALLVASSIGNCKIIGYLLDRKGNKTLITLYFIIVV